MQDGWYTMTEIMDGLHLGAAGDPGSYDHRIDLRSGSGDGPDRFPLSNSECDQETFDAAVERVLELLDDGMSVLVHCQQGRSRSAAVVACVLARREGTGLREAFQRLDAERGIAVSDAMRRCAVSHHRRHQETRG